MKNLKVFFVIFNLSIAMSFFQNCSKAELDRYSNLEDTSHQTPVKRMNLANEFPYKGEVLSSGNFELVSELARNQSHECGIQHEHGNSQEDHSQFRNCRVSICHVPLGNPSNSHTISISILALNAHMGEGSLDYIGDCDDDESDEHYENNHQIIDDGGGLVEAFEKDDDDDDEYHCHGEHSHGHGRHHDGCHAENHHSEGHHDSDTDTDESDSHISVCNNEDHDHSAPSEDSANPDATTPQPAPVGS